ncbi:gamma-aminobutyric acid receptor subunit beta-like, partial [Montipora foliosa]|uniref:gamma-aminobutyric acid receptor subunit beta-like n=1 Tax=Montipora foliosa TaxID=591990 RepID=UPI0035F11190
LQRVSCSSTEVSVNKTTLDRLFTTYDKDVRPNHGVGRLLIEVDLYVESFANIAEADMEYTVFGYLRHHWTDKRLAGKFQDPVLLKGTTIERAWLPDTYISNARESNFPQKDSESQSSLLVSSDGGLFYSKGVKIVASCDMRLEDFPMDTQECALFFSSYGYGVKDIIYKWKRDTATVEKTHIAQFVVNHVQIDSTNVTYESGNFTQLVIRFSFKRRIGYYVIQVYLPASLMVAISWIVFWLDQDDMGGRVGLGITTILTIMFLLGSVNTSLPRVSYPKAIDWFLIASFLMVFLVLAECIVVYILRPKKDDKNDGNELPVGFELEPDETNEEMLTEANGGKPINVLKKRQVVILERFLSNSEPVIPKARGFNRKIPFLPEKDAEKHMMKKYSAHAPSGKYAEAIRGCRRCQIAKIIDYICRFLFPLGFVLFNVCYWRHYLKD